MEKHVAIFHLEIIVLFGIKKRPIRADNSSKVHEDAECSSDNEIWTINLENKRSLKKTESMQALKLATR